ncbi:cupin domain-containing protein [Gordonia sp. (in: high G+C Gram-positive bacteria)]|uniref:cupin domain-containing protein n=1 Tax=Gordonia sp. (in: high G+C Gram-positive bacteria) TaxID=84139 RepID=UPI003C7948E0
MTSLDVSPSAFSYLTELNAPNTDGTGPKPWVKRIHKSDSETVVRLSFVAGQVMAEHMAVHPIIVLGQFGEIDFTVQGTTVRLQPGTAIRVDARTKHELTAVTDGTVTLIVIHGH